MSRLLVRASCGLLVLGVAFLGASTRVELPDAARFGAKLATLLGALGVAWGLVAPRLLTPRGADRLLGNLALAAVGFLVALTLAEWGTRLAFRDITTTGDNRSWFAARWSRSLHTNSLGFRGAEFEVPKPAARYRIAVVGDSYTWGQGVAAEDRFPDRLARALNEAADSATRFELLNFGRAGANTIHEIAILEESVLPADPDFVLLQWYVNDVEGRDRAQRPTSIPLLPSGFLMAELHRRSAFFYLVEQTWLNLQDRLGWRGSRLDYARRRFGDPGAPDAIAAREELRRFFSLCRERGILVGMVLFPSPTYDGTYEFVRRQALAACREEGVPCLDLAPVFARVEDVRSLHVNRFDAHPSALAHRLASEALLDAFGSRWRREAASR